MRQTDGLPSGAELGVKRAGMRTLIHIPIIHSQADMGALASEIQRLTVDRLGHQEWERSVRAVSQLWTIIGRTLEAYELPYPQVRLYQDGLPNCGREADIVRDVAQAGSPNHQLLLKLMEKGATLMGTEAPELLLEEYQLIQQVLDARDLGDTEQVEIQQQALSQALLERRDQYIAQRINDTLCEGEVGVLFLGLLHCLEGRLEGDIDVSYPVLRPACVEDPLVDHPQT